MSYIGAQPTTAAFVTDQFSGDGSTTVFTMSVAPANSASVIVAVSGVLQDPSTYAVSGTSLTFSGAPPTGTGNISARYLGLPASGVATTAYRTLTEFTATSGQTTFSVPSYTVGFINVYRNGVMLGTADFTATSGTTVVLAAGATSGDLVTTESFYVSGVSNAIPAVAGAVNTSYITDGAVTAVKMAASGAWAPAGTVIQVVSATSTSEVTTTSTTFVATPLSASITPTSTSSKILIQYTARHWVGASDEFMFSTIFRNGVDLVAAGSNLGLVQIYSANARPFVGTGASFLDSPSSTSNTTYTIYFKTSSGGTAGFGNNSQIATIILMEVAG
jgi:hypothetical protein